MVPLMPFTSAMISFFLQIVRIYDCVMKVKRQKSIYLPFRKTIQTQQQYTTEKKNRENVTEQRINNF